MDTDLKVLSPELKKLTHIYDESKREKLNERGTIVFLLGRNISTVADIKFRGKALLEKPCLSRSDCDKSQMGSGGGEDEHMRAVNDITVSYPQLNAFRAEIDAYQKLSNECERDINMQNAILNSIQEATYSPKPKVSAMAEEALKKLKPYKLPPHAADGVKTWL